MLLSWEHADITAAYARSSGQNYQENYVGNGNPWLSASARRKSGKQAASGTFSAEVTHVTLPRLPNSANLDKCRILLANVRKSGLRRCIQSGSGAWIRMGVPSSKRSRLSTSAATVRG